MLAYLRIKIVSLAAEAVLIRKAENNVKWKKVPGGRAKRKRTPTQDEVFFGLKDHRRGIVRSEARHAQLAYGYLRGLGYRELEANPQDPPNFNRLFELVAKYGKRTNRPLNTSALKAWLDVPPVIVPKAYPQKKEWDGLKKAARTG